VAFLMKEFYYLA